MNPLIERFDREHNAYNDVSPKRRRDSRRVLVAFEQHAGVPIEEATAPQLKAYLATLVEDGKAPGTVRKARNLILPFYTWASEVGLMERFALWEVRQVAAPRGGGSRPRPYPREDVHRLWADVARQYPLRPDDYYLNRFAKGTSGFKRIQDHARRIQLEAIVALGLFGGLRLSEVYNARADDIHPENAYIVVRGAKKNREAEERTRIVPWTTPDMKRMVGDWLVFREWLEPDHDALWLSLHQQPHYRKAMWFRTFEMLLHDLGRGWEFHRLRHTAITEMLRAGYPIQEVQRIAGHSRITQTLAYAELLPDDLMRTAARQSERLSTALSPIKEAA